MVMGHELAGSIEELGKGVKDIEVGTRVAVNPLFNCAQCDQCSAGKEQLCRNRKTIGVNTGLLGGFSEFIVAPVRNVIPLADEITFAEGSMAEPLAVGLRATNAADPQRGQPIAILGGGTIGLCTLMICRVRGASSVFVTDVSPHKLDMVARLGGEPLDPRNIDLAAIGREATGGQGFQKIIDAVAVSATIKEALLALAPGGTLTLVGLATPTVEIGLYDWVPQEKIIKSAYAYTAEEYKQAVEMLNTRRIDVRPLLEGRCSLAETPDVFEALAAGQMDAVKVVVEI
jgi:L-iditol 2-dehydrogenase